MIHAGFGELYADVKDRIGLIDIFAAGAEACNPAFLGQQLMQAALSFMPDERTDITRRFCLVIRVNGWNRERKGDRSI